MRRAGRDVVLGEECVHRSVQAHRHALHVAGTRAAQEFRETIVLVEHEVVVQSVDALAFQQAGDVGGVRSLERDVRDPVADARKGTNI